MVVAGMVTSTLLSLLWTELESTIQKADFTSSHAPVKNSKSMVLRNVAWQQIQAQDPQSFCKAERVFYF